MGNLASKYREKCTVWYCTLPERITKRGERFILRFDQKFVFRHDAPSLAGLPPKARSHLTYIVLRHNMRFANAN